MGNCSSGTAARLNQQDGLRLSPSEPGPSLLLSASQPEPSTRHPGSGIPARVKIVLLGDSGVGKSCLALRYVRGLFDDSSRATVGASFMSHTVRLPSGEAARLDLWDTAGQERYQSLAPLYYRGADGAVVVYDVTSARTFARAKAWVEELQQHSDQHTVVVLVGNKTDLWEQREVSEDEGRDYADSNSMAFVEASARAGTNVADVFEGLVRALAGGLPVSCNATVGGL
ncbi:hypothetical protein FOA52_003859 [Chlamydomonas sp. UWO 241]|nr:hypothetical protein FOA52_003859 [Chlamydomonas sp. UWO 241]